MASSAERPSDEQADATTNGIDVVSLVPGLQSVARATVTPCSISMGPGAWRERSVYEAPGTSTATPPALARPMASSVVTQSR
jgi:hypothetical protein